MGLVKTRRLAYPPLAGVRDPWGSEHAERKRVPSDAQTTTRKGRDEAAGEGRCREGRSATVCASSQSPAKGILDDPSEIIARYSLICANNT